MSSLHESDDQLELYTLDRLPVDALERVEEHLIICESCRIRAQEVGDFTVSMRQALRARRLGRVPYRRGWFEGWNLRFALAGSLACALLLAVLTYRNANQLKRIPVASLTLSAMRGGNAEVPPAREYNLTLDGARGDHLTVEVVTSIGGHVWQGPAAIRNMSAVVKIAKDLDPGTYYVRLNSASGELLHEYGFKVQP